MMIILFHSMRETFNLQVRPSCIATTRIFCHFQIFQFSPFSFSFIRNNDFVLVITYYNKFCLRTCFLFDKVVNLNDFLICRTTSHTSLNYRLTAHHIPTSFVKTVSQINNYWQAFSFLNNCVCTYLKFICTNFQLLSTHRRCPLTPLTPMPCHMLEVNLSASPHVFFAKSIDILPPP